MVNYDVYAFCNECSVPHRMGIGLALDDGPTKKESIGDTYAGREMPPQVANLINNQTVCPNTKKFFTQRDNNQIFLVPVG